MGKSIDEVRGETCPKCGKRLTVIGHEQPPRLWVDGVEVPGVTRVEITTDKPVTVPPVYEHIGLSKTARARVDRVSRGLVLSALEKES